MSLSQTTVELVKLIPLLTVRKINIIDIPTNNSKIQTKELFYQILTSTLLKALPYSNRSRVIFEHTQFRDSGDRMKKKFINIRFFVQTVKLAR